MKDEDIRKVVRDGYAQIPKSGDSCCTTSCSYCGQPQSIDDISKIIGYQDKELAVIPEGANLGLGCGNPTALASLKEGETVIDLGAGGGLDCFLAATIVGKKGKVIGIDMTPEMIDRAIENCRKGNYKNVEFRLGEIENIPAADGTADLVMSNCVINLSPDKGRVFREAFRVLKPQGRLIVSDMVLLKDLPDYIKESPTAYIGCIAGAIKKDAYLEAIREAGFKEVEVINETIYPVEYACPDQQAGINKSDEAIKSGEDLTDIIESITVQGMKPDNC